MFRRTALSLVLLALVAAACGGQRDRAQPTPTTLYPPPTAPRGASSSSAPAVLASARVRLTTVADGLTQPLALAVRPGDRTLYVAQQGGLVRAVRDGRVDPQPVLDLAAQTAAGGERGLLGLVFSSDGSRLYVNYTDLSGDTNVDEVTMAGDRADPASRRRILFVKQPYPNHNGGNLVFGPDGLLWIGLGDGGSSDDPQNNAQNPATVLGKMLRLDPRAADPRPEIWGLGLRNPFRYSFDRVTADLWIGDVGQNAREEIDFVPAGTAGPVNFGWPALEGTRPNKGQPVPGSLPPVYEYNTHQNGTCSVIGGYVYRGTRIPALNGVYLFADECVGDVMGLVRQAGRGPDVRSLGVQTPALASFGQDNDGELYVVSLQGRLSRIDPA